MILDMVQAILTGDNVGPFLADNIEERFPTHPQTPKLTKRLRGDVRLITLCSVVAQFGMPDERRIIQKAQRLYRGRHRLGNSTAVRTNSPGAREMIFQRCNGNFWKEFNKVIMDVLEYETC